MNDDQIAALTDAPCMTWLFMGDLCFDADDGSRVDVPSAEALYRDERYAVGFFDGCAWRELWNGHAFDELHPRYRPTHWMHVQAPPAREGE